MSFQPWALNGNGGPKPQPPPGFPATNQNSGVSFAPAFQIPGSISASSSMTSNQSSNSMFSYTSTGSSATTIVPESARVQLQPNTQEIARFLAQASWMRFSVVAQPDFSSITKDPRFRDFIGRVSGYTMQSVNQQIHQELIQSVNQVVANLAASVDQRVAAVQWAILNELESADAEYMATPQDWLNPNVLDSFLAGLQNMGNGKASANGDANGTNTTVEVPSENDSLDSSTPSEVAEEQEVTEGDLPSESDGDTQSIPSPIVENDDEQDLGDEQPIDTTTTTVPGSQPIPVEDESTPSFPSAETDLAVPQPDDDSLSNTKDDSDAFPATDEAIVPDTGDDQPIVAGSSEADIDATIDDNANQPAPDEVPEPTSSNETDSTPSSSQQNDIPDNTKQSDVEPEKEKETTAPQVEAVGADTSIPQATEPVTNAGSSGAAEVKAEAFLSSPVPLAGSEWIWTQEADENPRPNPPHARAFRHTITTDKPVNTLTIDIAGERRYTLYVNGLLVGMGDTWDVPDRYTVRFSNTTKVVLAAYVAQSEYRANVGLVASGQVWDAWETPNPVGIVFRTNEDWKTISSDVVSGDFIQPDFDDASWERSFSQALFAEGPWRTKSKVINNGGRPHEYVQGIASVPDAFSAPLAELLKPPLQQ